MWGANPLRRVAGSLVIVWLRGSTSMPTDSSAVTPSSGSASFSPNTMVPHVVSPINSIRPPVMSNRASLPSAKPYLRCPSGTRPMDSRCCLGTRQSVAPISTRKSPSHTRPGSAGFHMATVTWVAPIAQSLFQETSLLNYTIPSNPAISMATRQTHHRHSCGGRNPSPGRCRQFDSARSHSRPPPALLDSGSGAGMTDVEAAVNSVLPVAQSTPARPPGFRLVGRNDGCGGRRQLGSAGRTVDPRPPSWIPARGPE